MSVESCCGMFRGQWKAERCLTAQEIADGVTYPEIDLGNVSAFQLSTSINELTKKSYIQKCGLDCYYPELESVNFSMELNCVQANLLNIALGGESYEFPGGNQTDEFLYNGGTTPDDLTFCPSLFAKSVVAIVHETSGDITSFFDFVNGKFVYNGDTSVGNGPLTEDVPESITIEYVACAYSKVNLFTCVSIYHSITFEGCNVLDNKPVKFSINRVRISPTSGLDLIGDDLLTYEVTGVALPTGDTITDPNANPILSPYGCFIFAA